VRLLLTLAIVVASWPSPATAQIYSWRDAEGRLVVSNRPGEDVEAMTTYAVPGTQAVRATTPTRARNPRAAAYDAYIDVHAASQGISADLVRAVIQVESAYDARAVSTKGAMGLMQLMPATARELGVEDPFHPEDNIRGGVAYLRQLLDRYDSNVELALAAYNAGPGSVAKYGGTVPPYRETQAYVKKITGADAAPPTPPPPTIYKWIETIDGRAIVRYSNKAPAGVAATPVGK
jgi:soluble lytic murein transglycosylase-like protein